MRALKEENESVTDCHELKIPSKKDGKKYKTDFKKYYYNFLEYKGHENIIYSNNRKKDINNFYYPVIIANYKDKTIYSINPNYFEELKKIHISEKDTKEKILDFFKQCKIDIAIQDMYRMYKKTITNIDISMVTELNDNNKEQYYNSFEHTNDHIYKQKKWETIRKYKYLNGIIEDNKFVSVGFVSNIDENGANIVIQTKEKYRNKGYGKAIVEKISRDLLKHNIIPIYWVNKENKASIKLAQTLDFKKEAEEIVVKIIN
ncbi:MAG: GNAT family N-acetyltransferase [Clostridia bacterium]|nr:GNAT family N-acetyltransferase [Clostridia bacterium]